MRSTEFIDEASYKGNIGAMEVFKFYKIANPLEISTLKRLMAEENYKEAWDLIQKVSGIKLHSMSPEVSLDEDKV